MRSVTGILLLCDSDRFETERELHLFRRFGLTQRGEMQLSNSEHHRILDKIAAGDPEGVAEAMRIHTSERRRKMLLRPDKFDLHRTGNLPCERVPLARQSRAADEGRKLQYRQLHKQRCPSPL